MDKQLTSNQYLGGSIPLVKPLLGLSSVISASVAKFGWNALDLGSSTQVANVVGSSPTWGTKNAPVAKLVETHGT